MKTKSIILIISLVCLAIAGIAAMMPDCEQAVCAIKDSQNGVELPSMMNLFVSP